MANGRLGGTLGLLLAVTACGGGGTSKKVDPSSDGQDGGSHPHGGGGKPDGGGGMGEAGVVAAKAVPTTIVTSGGVGTGESGKYRLQLTVGAPQPSATGKSESYRLRLGVRPPQ